MEAYIEKLRFVLRTSGYISPTDDLSTARGTMDAAIAVIKRQHEDLRDWERECKQVRALLEIEKVRSSSSQSV